jgi:hypothetical protein
MTTLTIAKLPFELSRPLPYAVGHVCSARDASALNQAWTEALRNNYAARVREALKECPEGPSTEAMATLQRDFAQYAEHYDWVAKPAPKSAVNPIEAEAHKLAKVAVVASLKRREVDIKSFPSDQLETLVQRLLAKTGDYRLEAQRRHDAALAASADAVEVIDSLDPTPEIETEAVPLRAGMGQAPGHGH